MLTVTIGATPLAALLVALALAELRFGLDLARAAGHLATALVWAAVPLACLDCIGLRHRADTPWWSGLPYGWLGVLAMLAAALWAAKIARERRSWASVPLSRAGLGE